jgi:hypothetical protein
LQRVASQNFSKIQREGQWLEQLGFEPNGHMRFLPTVPRAPLVGILPATPGALASKMLAYDVALSFSPR